MVRDRHQQCRLALVANASGRSCYDAAAVRQARRAECHPGDFEAIATQIERLLQQRLGLEIAATLVRPGELDALTEFRPSPKPKRWRDERQHTVASGLDGG